MKIKIKKGSFTVEAACVMSLILLTIIGTMYLSFFVHNKIWLTAAACEAALIGSGEGILENGKPEEAASNRAHEVGNVGFFGTENLSCNVSTGDNVTVAYSADVISGFGGFKWKINAKASSKIIRPARWIRKIKAAAEMVKGLGD